MIDKTIPSNGGSVIVGGSFIGGGSAIGGGTCHICNKPIYMAGSPTDITFDILQQFCKGHPTEKETYGNELEAAKARIKELEALVTAGDYSQRKTVETTRFESQGKDGLRVVVKEVTSYERRGA